MEADGSSLAAGGCPIVSLPSCDSCAQAEGCLVAALPMGRGFGLDRLFGFSRRVATRRALYCTGEALAAIYLVRSGSFKSLITNADGREQITGLHLPGSLLGIEAIASGQHTRSVFALEACTVCVLPTGALDDLVGAFPGVQRWFHRRLSREIGAAAADLTLLGNRSAEARLAAFLLDLSRRVAGLGHSPRDFDLRLSRQDIASHLGLSAATVSRLFTRLINEKVICAARRRVQLLDVEFLRQLATHHE